MFYPLTLKSGFIQIDCRQLCPLGWLCSSPVQVAVPASGSSYNTYATIFCKTFHLCGNNKRQQNERIKSIWALSLIKGLLIGNPLGCFSWLCNCMGPDSIALLIVQSQWIAVFFFVWPNCFASYRFQSGRLTMQIALLRTNCWDAQYAHIMFI